MGETSADVRIRVEAARQRQRERFGGTDIASNADMRPAQIRKYCVLDDACQALMKTAMHQLQLTARAYHWVLKLSRTIADLDGANLGWVHLEGASLWRANLDCATLREADMQGADLRKARYNDKTDWRFAKNDKKLNEPKKILTRRLKGVFLV